ncbi:MAG: sulfatase-like hydrolase/transferase [Cellulosilyticaceae bacterium]
MKKPNILMIMTDQQRFDTVSYTNHYLKLTPRLDELAMDSTIFTNAYTPAPTCGPARAAIQTGMYPPTCGVVENLSAAKENVQYLAERLLKQGYDTGLSGKLHLSPADKKYGFNFKKLHDAPYSVYGDEDKDSCYIKALKEQYAKDKKADPVEIFDRDETSYNSDIYKFIMGSGFRSEAEHDIPWTVNGAIEFLEKRDMSKPFFLMTSFFGPHHPYLVPSPWDKQYDESQIQLPDNFYASMDDKPIFQQKAAGFANRLKNLFDETQYKKIIAANYNQIAMIDHYIGNLLTYLKENNLYENTVIIFTSDHGDLLGSYGLFFKTHMYEGSSKVPMLIKMPEARKKMCIKNEVVNTLDLYRTILELAGDEDWEEETIESKSLIPLLEDQKEGVWDNATYSIMGNKVDHVTMMMRNNQYKVIRLQRGDKEPLYEIYNLENDPQEMDNIENNPAAMSEEVKQYLKQKLDQWAKRQLKEFPTEIISYRKKI